MMANSIISYTDNNINSLSSDSEKVVQNENITF